MDYIFISESEDFPEGSREIIQTLTFHKKEGLVNILNLIKELNCVDCIVVCNTGTEDYPNIINVASIQTIAGKRYVTGPV